MLLATVGVARAGSAATSGQCEFCPGCGGDHVYQGGRVSHRRVLCSARNRGRANNSVAGVPPIVLASSASSEPSTKIPNNLQVRKQRTLRKALCPLPHPGVDGDGALIGPPRLLLGILEAPVCPRMDRSALRRFFRCHGKLCSSERCACAYVP